MNTELRTSVKNDIKKDFFKIINKSIFARTMENVRNHKDIWLVMSENRRNKWISEPNYDAREALLRKTSGNRNT